MSDLTLTSPNVGLDSGFLGDFAKRFGDALLQLVARVLDDGWNKALAVEAIERLGPLCLELVVAFLEEGQRLGAADPMIEGDIVGLDTRTIRLILSDMVNKHSDAILRNLSDFIKDKWGDRPMLRLFLPMLEQYAAHLLQQLRQWLET